MNIEEQLSFLQEDLHRRTNGEYNDGIVIITQFMPNGQIKNIPVKSEDLSKELMAYIGIEDVYYSVNTTYNGHRGGNNIRQLVALYADIDLKDTMSELQRKKRKKQIINKLIEISLKSIIPMPSFLVDSGGGIHAYWAIKDLPYQATWMWQAVEDHILFLLNANGIEIDSSVRDSSRILRSPGTLNKGRECEVVMRNCNKYDLKELYNEFIPTPARGLKADTKAKLRVVGDGKIPLESLKINTSKDKNKEAIKNISDTIMAIKGCKLTPYTLHQARLADIITLCMIRQWDLEGYRSSVMNCYVYWKGIILRNKEDLLESALGFNNRFKKPLPQSAIVTTVRSTKKAVDKFLKYEADIKSGIGRRVTKGMRDKPGYWYKNTTLISLFDITEEEQEKMITIIDIKTKRKRDSKKKRDLRRNEEGLLKRELQRRSEFIVIAKLKSEGLSIRQIAKKMSKDHKTILEKIENSYKRINYKEIEEAYLNNEYYRKDVDKLLKDMNII